MKTINSNILSVAFLVLLLASCLDGRRWRLGKVSWSTSSLGKTKYRSPSVPDPEPVFIPPVLKTHSSSDGGFEQPKLGEAPPSYLERVTSNYNKNPPSSTITGTYETQVVDRPSPELETQVHSPNEASSPVYPRYQQPLNRPSVHQSAQESSEQPQSSSHVLHPHHYERSYLRHNSSFLGHEYKIWTTPSTRNKDFSSPFGSHNVTFGSKINSYNVQFGRADKRSGFQGAGSHSGKFMSMLTDLASNTRKSNYHVYHNSEDFRHKYNINQSSDSINEEKLSLNFGNMTCVTIYNVKLFASWANFTIQEVERQIEQTFDYTLIRRINLDESHTGQINFNYTAEPGTVVHNETVSITCCGREETVLDFQDLVSGRSPSANCVHRAVVIPFRALTVKTVNTTVKIMDIHNAKIDNGTNINSTDVVDSTITSSTMLTNYSTPANNTISNDNSSVALRTDLSTKLDKSDTILAVNLTSAETVMKKLNKFDKENLTTSHPLNNNVLNVELINTLSSENSSVNFEIDDLTTIPGLNDVILTVNVTSAESVVEKLNKSDKENIAELKDNNMLNVDKSDMILTENVTSAESTVEKLNKFDKENLVEFSSLDNNTLKVEQLVSTVSMMAESSTAKEEVDTSSDAIIHNGSTWFAVDVPVIDIE